MDKSIPIEERKELRLSSIEMVNSQKHKYLFLEFEKGITGITGKSDAGKSSIFNAIKFVLYDRLTDDSLINYDADQMSVKLTFGNDFKNDIIVIERIKTRKSSHFVINGIEYNKSGRTSGIELLENLINLSNININEQHDPFFLIIDSKENVGREVQQIYGLDNQTNILTHFVNNEKTTRNKLLKLGKELDGLNNKLNDHCSNFIDKSKQLIEQFDKFTIQQSKNERIVDLLTQYILHQEQIDMITKIDPKTIITQIETTQAQKEKATQIGRFILERSDTLKKITSIDLITEKISEFIKHLHINSEYQNKMTTIQNYISSSDLTSGFDVIKSIFMKVVDQLHANNQIQKKTDLLSDYIRHNETTAKIESVDVAVNNYYTTKQKIQVCNSYMETQTLLADVLSQLSEFSDILCPTCGQISYPK